ncbi:MAG: hypothetical protein ACE5HC_17080 [Candidatus Binatia bacterium]
MKRRLLLLLAIVVSGALPLSAWADVSLVKTADGTEFKFGMSEKMQTFTLSDLDLMGGNTDFRSFISPDTALGDQDWGIQNFANLLFTMERGPLRIHANLEVEAALDAAAVDVNRINLERMALYYKFPTIGTLAVGMDVHAFDPEGGLIYTDEHPGLWLVGGDDSVSWDLAWHLVLTCQRGASLFSNAGTFCPRAGSIAAVQQETDQQNHLFLARVNFNVGNGTVVSPLIAYSRRHVPQAELNEFSDPLGVVGAGFSNADFATTGEGSYSDQFRPGVAVKSTLGPVTITGEFVGLLGQIKNVDTFFLGGTLPPAVGITKEDFDLRSYALFFEVAVPGSQLGLPAGLTPYVSVEVHSGDGDPFDDTYAGYVPISNLSQALRKDGFKGQSIGSYGPSTLGASSEDGWGFDVTSRGQGPTLGTIVPDETLGVDGSTFNNRGGKGGNPGFFKVAGGVTGKIDQNLDTHFGFNLYWYNTTEPLEAEAAQNCIARAWLAGCAAAPGLGVSDPVSVRAAQTALKTAGIDLDKKYMGFEFNGNVGYTFNGGFRIQPYFSVFVPGSVVEEISAAYLSTSSSSLFKNKVTSFTGGVEFSAAF